MPYLGIKWEVYEVIVAGPVDEVFPLHDDVAVLSGVNVRLDGPDKQHNSSNTRYEG